MNLPGPAALDAQEHAAMLDAIGRVQRRVAAALQSMDDPQRAVQFVVHLQRGVDDLAARAAAAGPAPDCHAGCAHCCRVRVEATDPEVLRIAHGLARQPAAQRNAVVERLRAHVAQQAAPRPGSTLYCSFLVDRQCSIYALRPAACRKAHSLSVQQCADFAPQIPQNLKLLTEAEAMMAGTAAAYRQVGLPARGHELNAAVLLALSDESAQSRWFKGENVF